MSWSDINGRPRMISSYENSQVNLTLPDHNKVAFDPNELNQWYWVAVSHRLSMKDFKKNLVRIAGKTRIVFTDEKDGSVSFSKEYRNLALRALTTVFPEVAHLSTRKPGYIKCDTRCHDAEGLECLCKCNGDAHQAETDKSWKRVAETTLIKRNGTVAQREEILTGTQEHDEPLSQEGWDSLCFLFDRYQETGTPIFSYANGVSADQAKLHKAFTEQKFRNEAKFNYAFLSSKPVGEQKTQHENE